MGTFGTNVNPAHFVEIADTLDLGQVKRPTAGLVIKARVYGSGTALPDIVTGDYGYWSASFPSVDAIEVSGNSGTTWVGPLISGEAEVAGATAGATADAASALATTANNTANLALTTAQNGPAATWSNITGKPATFPPDPHTHDKTQITGTSTTVQSLLAAADQQTARLAIGAGTGNGTSNLVIGTTAGTAAAGNHTHQASAISFAPTSSITATDVQTAIQQAATMGGTGTGGGGAILPVIYGAGAYPVQAATPPAGVTVRMFLGPTQYVGPTWPGVVDLYNYAALT